MKIELFYASQFLELQSQITKFISSVPSECMGDKLIHDLWHVYNHLDEHRIDLMEDC